MFAVLDRQLLHGRLPPNHGRMQELRDHDVHDHRVGVKQVDAPDAADEVEVFQGFLIERKTLDAMIPQRQIVGEAHQFLGCGTPNRLLRMRRVGEPHQPLTVLAVGLLGVLQGRFEGRGCRLVHPSPFPRPTIRMDRTPPTASNEIRISKPVSVRDMYKVLVVPAYRAIRRPLHSWVHRSSL